MRLRQTQAPASFFSNTAPIPWLISQHAFQFVLRRSNSGFPVLALLGQLRAQNQADPPSRVSGLSTLFKVSPLSYSGNGCQFISRFFSQGFPQWVLRPLRACRKALFKLDSSLFWPPCVLCSKRHQLSFLQRCARFRGHFFGLAVSCQTGVAAIWPSGLTLRSKPTHSARNRFGGLISNVSPIFRFMQANIIQTALRLSPRFFRVLALSPGFACVSQMVKKPFGLWPLCSKPSYPFLQRCAASVAQRFFMGCARRQIMLPVLASGQLFAKPAWRRQPLTFTPLVPSGQLYSALRSTFSGMGSAMLPHRQTSSFLALQALVQQSATSYHSCSAAPLRVASGFFVRCAPSGRALQNGLRV